MSLKTLGVVVGIVVLVGAFVVAGIVDAEYNLNLLIALQGIGAFALLAVTGVYAITTKRLLDSQVSHYADVAKQADREARMRTFEKMTPFSTLTGELSGAHRRFFEDPAGQASGGFAPRLHDITLRIVKAVQDVLGTIPGLSDEHMAIAQTFALQGTNIALVSQRLAILVGNENSRAAAAGEPFALARVAEAWELPDDDGRTYPRWSEIRDGSNLAAAVLEQTEGAGKMLTGSV